MVLLYSIYNEPVILENAFGFPLILAALVMPNEQSWMSESEKIDTCSGELGHGHPR